MPDRRTDRRPSTSLPDPVVPPHLYDDDYFREACLGATEWSESQGMNVHRIYTGALQRAGVRAGDTVVDIGTGRGELLAVAVQSGAARAIGIEYAEAGTALAKQTLQGHAVQDRAIAVLADARLLPLATASTDIVTMLDVVEHLAPRELQLTLAEAFRILRPGGRVLVHTMPNRTIYGVTYRVLRWSHPRRWRTWPSNPRNDYERAMHVNELTVTSLKRVLRRAGFRSLEVKLGGWIYTDHVPSKRGKRLYHRLAAIPMLARLGTADFWGVGIRP